MFGLGAIKDIAGEIVGPIRDLVDDVTTSKEERLQAEAKIQEIENVVTTRLIALRETIVKEQSEIIQTETTGRWYQRAWRPGFMYLFMLILANTVIIGPYIAIFAGDSYVVNMINHLEAIPAQMWQVIMIGLGGYIGGRSLEKITDSGGLSKTLKNLKGGSDE